ncbi:MAG: LLM class flavin-dependent oxidoreductase [Acetobacteraceae bacterium]|nr:LLM class flavin-dependent oxidoreductase [Acetobacteraceae bacterium]
MIARPKPVQKPHPLIHVGGAFPHGARRAIRYGDGWISTARGDVAEVLPKFREMAGGPGAIRHPSRSPRSAWGGSRSGKALGGYGRRPRRADVPARAGRPGAADSGPVDENLAAGQRQLVGSDL